MPGGYSSGDPVPCGGGFLSLALVWGMWGRNGGILMGIPVNVVDLPVFYILVCGTPVIFPKLLGLFLRDHVFMSPYRVDLWG